MRCPICGARLFSGADRCPDCGCHVQAYAAPAEDAPAPRARRHGVRLILTLLTLLPVLAVIVFTTLISVSVRSPLEMDVSVPVEEHTTLLPPARQTDPLPEDTADCFTVTAGKLVFHPDRWTGGPVLKVPETVNGRTVTALAPGCFAGCTELTTIVLPDSLLQIGPNAFTGCSRLRGLFVPEGTCTIGTDAFAGCLELEAVYIPSTMGSIAQDCFSDCAGLLYIFYNGSFTDWNDLCDDYITPFTAAVCLDGTYYHGAGG